MLNEGFTASVKFYCITRVKFILLITSIILLVSCHHKPKQEELIIFHAGSLSVPFKQIENAFEKEHPNINIILEAAGSRTCARKISDLGRKCDIMASADYKVIDNLLVPDHASENYKFATNQMVIAFSEHSKYSNEITSNNWANILLRNDVSYGRSDPNSDPCGYRSVMCAKLAAIYYERPKLSDSLLSKDNRHIRPKEVDLLALLETRVIDYLFIYKSVAQQHKLKYINLPDSINLGNANLSNFYKQVSIKVSGKTPTDSIVLHGAPMVYGITKPINGGNPELADTFLRYFFNPQKGLKIIETNGQNSINNQFNK